MKTKLNFEIIEWRKARLLLNWQLRHWGSTCIIAKTMAFRLREENILIVAQGDARVDNRKYKDYFKEKAKMLKPDEVFEATDIQLGFVLWLKESIEYLFDISLKKFEYVYPAAGSRNSAVKMTPAELQEITEGKWIDVCKDNCLENS